jgi:DegV family protein with EDD domain
MIAIVTDSPADIPPEIAAQLNITVVPAILVIGAESFKDGVDLSRADFYDQLPGMAEMPTTAAPSSGDYAAAYQRLFAAGAEHIVSIHVAASLSAIHNAALLAAEAYAGQVSVVDSGQLSLGLGFQVIAAAKAAAAGASLPDVLRAIQDTRRRTVVIAMLDTLEYLRRGGRVSLLQASLGAMLRVRLFVELHNGRINFLERVRTRAAAIERLWDMVVTQGPFDQFAMLHANAEAEARNLLDELIPSLPANPLLVNVNTVVGTHVGPNALGFAAVLRK